MYYFLYKTTNTLNGKFYIGVHSTVNLNDGYLGSGTIIKKAIKKYGKEVFVREILEFFGSKEEMFARETELVSEDFVKDHSNYNVHLGGKGGWDNYLNKGKFTVLKYDGTYKFISVSEREETDKILCSGKVSVVDKYGNTFQVSTSDERYLSGELKFVCKGKVPVRDSEGNCFQVEVDDPRYLSGELKHVATGVNKGKVLVRDEEGNTFKVSKTDERYLLGELQIVNKGMVTAVKPDGSFMYVSKDDPRLKSGELKYYSVGKVCVRDAEGNRFVVNKDDPRYLSGELVSANKGRIWINNGTIEKFIYKEELVNYPEFVKGKKSRSPEPSIIPSLF